MADNEKDQKAGGADASSKPKEKGGFEHTAERFGVQALNRFKKPLARLIVNNLTPELKAKIVAHQDAVETVSTLIATLPPNQGILGHLTDDLQQGVVNEVIEQLKAEQGSASTTATPPKPAFDEAKEVRRILVTVAVLPDQSKRDQFNHWLQDLKKTPDQCKTFLALAAASNDADLKTLVQLPTSELDDLLAALPPTPQEKKPMTYLELRAAVAADADLNRRVQDFLTAIGADPASKFEAAVKRNLNSEIKSVDDFKAMMAMSDDEIKRYLKLDEKSIQQTIHDNVTASGVVAAAGKFRDGAKGFFDRALGKL